MIVETCSEILSPLNRSRVTEQLMSGSKIFVDLLSCYAEHMGHDHGDRSARSEHPHSLARALTRYYLCQCAMHITGILGPALQIGLVDIKRDPVIEYDFECFLKISRGVFAFLHQNFNVR